jgi:putative ABC transport system permease protein
MWKTTLKSVRAHKRRLLATCLAVMFGVAFLSATLVVGDTMTAGFSDIFAESNAGTDAVVRNATQVGEDDIVERGRVDADLAQQIAAVDGVAAAAPEIWGYGRIVGADGDPLGGNGPPTFAANWITDDGLNPYDLAEGRPPAAPGEAVVDKGAAEEGDLAIGDTTTIRVPEPVEVTIVGLASFAGADSAGPTTYAAFTTDWASELLLPGEPDKATSIRVAAEPGVSQAELVDRLDPVLPDGVESLTGAQLTAEMEDDIQGDFLGFFSQALLVFAGVSLVVATFSIYNTFSILVAQRTRESALLRALGASRGQVLRSIAVEALAVGIVASAVGIAAGIGLAAGMLAIFGAIGISLPAHALVIGTGSVVSAAAVGVIVTLAASLVPALRASRTAPMAALRAVAVDRSGASWWRAGVGLVVTGAGVAAVLRGTSGDGNFSLTGLGALVTLVGVVLLGPVAARPVAGLLAAPGAALRGVTGSLARRNAMRNPRRTAGTASALMVGVAVVSLFTVVGASIKESMNATIAEQYKGDLVVSDPAFSSVGFSPELSAAIAGLDEVDATSSLSNAPLRVDGKDTLATTIEPATFDPMLDLDVVGGGKIADVGDDEVAVSQDYADDHHLALGDPLPLTFADGGSAEPTVGAIYTRGNLMGDLLVPEALFLPHTATPSDFVIMITLAGGTSLDQGEQAIQAVADRFGAPDVQTGDEYVKTASGQVDQVLNLVYGLLVLAIVIALMGIANTLSLSIHERSRELGLLRAVGQTRRQLRSMVRGEAATVALFGTAGGVGLGIFLGWALVDTLASEGFTSFAIPAGPLAVVMAIGALVGVVAAVRPARRAARMDVLSAIATD